MSLFLKENDADGARSQLAVGSWQLARKEEEKLKVSPNV
jgi:hypothetical protein